MAAQINQFLLRNLLRFSVFFIFIGRAWQHLFWDAPYRALFWDESLLKPVVELLLDTTWYDYVTSETTDNMIQNIIFCTGVLYVLAAFSSLFYARFRNKILKCFILFGGFNLFLLSVLLMKDKYYHFAQFFEHSIQFMLPFVFVFSLDKQWVYKNLSTVLKLLIAIVFVSHGLYAVGYYPVPGKFVDMIISILSISETNALLFLHIAGMLDFLIAIFIFIPKISKYALWYAFIWGILTALARVVANFQVDFALQSIHQELYGTVYRLAHGLVPLFVLLFMYKKKNSYRGNSVLDRS